jgi:hypothetical protein
MQRPRHHLEGAAGQQSDPIDLHAGANARVESGAGDTERAGS